MTDATPEKVLRSWFEEVWNAGRSDLIEHYLPPHGIIHALDETGADGVGPAAFRAFHDKMRGAFSDIEFTIHDVISAGPMVAGRWSVRMTHSGDGLGVPSTGRGLTFSGIAFARIESGQIIEAWNEWDRLTFATTLGLVAAVA